MGLIFTLLSGPGVPLSNFDWDSGVPLLNFSGVPRPTSKGPGPFFATCLVAINSA